mgnify:CR=1 FL=1
MQSTEKEGVYTEHLPWGAFEMIPIRRFHCRKSKRLAFVKKQAFYGVMQDQTADLLTASQVLSQPHRLHTPVRALEMWFNTQNKSCHSSWSEWNYGTWENLVISMVCIPPARGFTPQSCVDN